MPRKAKSLDTLLRQVNAIAPKRSKRDDGWLGDSAHQARKSDHNPNKKGVVQAIDITHDPKGGCDSYALAEVLRSNRDRRIKYVISNSRIFSSVERPWVWRKYSGSNSHSQHVHISVGDVASLYDDDKEWNLDGFGIPEPPDVEAVDEPAPKKTGISEGAIAGGGLGIADAGSQMWDAASSAPQGVWEAVIEVVKQPRFLVAVAVVGICIFIYLQRRKAKRA